MSSRTGSIGEQNCNNLLPFVCEKGTKPYQEPVLWRKDIVVVVLLLLLLLFIVAILIVCACRSAHRDDKLFYKRKQFFRESLVRKSRQNGRLPVQTANTDIFDTMNPRASISNLAAAAQNGKLLNQNHFYSHLTFQVSTIRVTVAEAVKQPTLTVRQTATLALLVHQPIKHLLHLHRLIQLCRQQQQLIKRHLPPMFHRAKTARSW